MRRLKIQQNKHSKATIYFEDNTNEALLECNINKAELIVELWNNEDNHKCINCGVLIDVEEMKDKIEQYGNLEVWKTIENIKYWKDRVKCRQYFFLAGGIIIK
jgi:hypothetical protein